MRLAPWLLLGSLAGAQEPPTVPTFSSRVDLVTVDVVVLDQDRKPVRGLTREDFRLFEDGQAREIVSFEAFLGGSEEEGANAASTTGPAASRMPAGARSFVLLIDDLSIAPWRQKEVHAAALRFLNEGLRDGDELTLATTSRDIWWSARMPEGRDDVAVVLGRVRGRSLSDEGRDAVSEWEAFRISHFEGPGGEASIGSSGAGPPAGPPTAPAPVSVAGADITERVVMRYYERRVCNPDPPAVTPRSQCASMVTAKARFVDQRRANRTRDVLAAVDRAVFALSGIRGRKALLLMTEGFLNDPNLPGTLEIAGRCREANVAVHSIDVRGLIAAGPGTSAADWGGDNPAEMGAQRAELVELQAAGNVGLAEDTGGFAVRNTNDLGGGAVRVADESRVYYLLGFAPPDGKGPRDWRKLKVETSRQGLEVRARKGYTLRSAAEIAGTAAPPREAKAQDGTSKATEAAAPSPVPVDVARALLAPQERDGIPLRAQAYAFDERPSGRVAVMVAVEADLAALANLGGDRPRGVLSMSVTATHRDSNFVRRVDERVTVDAGQGGAWEGWLLLQRELELPPGVVQARVVLKDEFLGRLGAVTVRFEVPEAAGPRLTPILTDRLRAAQAGQAPRPVLVARRDFAPTSRLYCQLLVFGAQKLGQAIPAFEGRYSVRRGGTTVREGPLRPLAAAGDGRLAGALALPLEGLAAGAYELVIEMEDRASGRTLARVEPFRIKG
jgi:hypothetical protein